MSQNCSLVFFPVSQKSAEQSGVITTTGGNPNENEALNLSCGSNISHVSHISSILPKDVSNTVTSEEDDPVVKSMIVKKFECEEKEQEKHQLEIKREEAKEKASVLWRKMQETEEQKAAEEKIKQQKLREEEESRWKHEEKRRVTKQHEMKLKQQLKEKYMKNMELEKERLEMKKIEEKYGSELLSEVRKDMGLPTLPVPNLDPSTGQHPSISYPPYGNRSELLAKVKQEKYHITELGDPGNPYEPSTTTSPHGKQWQLGAGGNSTPPPK